ncbi:uncharacterized protein KIAA1958-like [Pecten maximus]|uniref:uncharacterized protein KIAA1958-like n=1 Tax=Pecten maximus TaxID=6579 RepID=UPI001458D58A|nr:uncharacterized protein KIAA1958-like [Pecten maximus]
MAFAGNFDILHDLLMDSDISDESSIHEAGGMCNEMAISGNGMGMGPNSHSSTIASCAPPPSDPIPEAEPHVSSEIDDADVIPSSTYTSGVSDLRNYIMSKRNENTVKKTEGCIKRFQECIQSPPRYDSRDILQILPFELDIYIGGFLLSLQKNDGSNYEPDTLTSFHRGIDRYLRENGYLVNILTSDLFSTSRQVLQSRRKELKQKGLGNRPNKAEPVSENEEEMLWECGQLGHGNPHALLNTVWFNNTKLLGFRGCDENRQLKWGDIELKRDENGSEYLEFNERTTKTRGGNSTHVRSFNPKQFQNPEIKWRCPIEAYKLYAKHRPQAMNTPESPFYIAVNQNSTGGKWFKNQPVGRNKLGVMMKTMASNAGLTGKKPTTNP